jgi:dTDP-4-dehydrorhamnose reductase
VKVLITGAHGQLGRALLQQVPAGITAVGCGHGELDITQAQAIEQILQREQPQVVLNAAAFTAVDRAEAQSGEAFKINAEGPALLAGSCKTRHIRLIQVSTDYVFSGEHPRPLTPDAPTGPLNVYGASKLQGELCMTRQLPEALIVRTSWVYGAEGHNILPRLLSKLRAGESLRVVMDQTGAPTWVRSLSTALWRAAVLPEICGAHHWCDSGMASWYDFATAIGEEALALGLLKSPASILPITSAEYPTPARRPAYSVLDKRSLEQALNFAAPHWRANLRLALKELI